MGFWHTGYLEFHDPVDLEGFITEPSVPVFPCEQCGASFPSFEQLRRHRFEQHPAKRPVLYVRGREVGGAPLRVTRALQPTDIQTLHTSVARVNGRPVPLGELGLVLSKTTTSIADIRLQGEVSADFRLQFEIASQEDTVGIERCFRAAAYRGRLDRHAIENVIESAQPYESAMAYCDGICEYLYGVLAKERSPESSLPYQEYRNKFNRAVDILRDVDRPLARIVQGLVAFHFNHFAIAADCSPTSRVGTASRRYQKWILPLGGSSDSHGSSHGQTLDSLLTDLETERLLRWVLMPLDAALACATEIEAAVDRDIPEFDRAKLRILIAEMYSRIGRHSDAKRHARELLNNPSFGPWAEAMLRRNA